MPADLRPDGPERLITVTEAAALLPVGGRTVREWAAQGILPTARLLPGGMRWFRLGDVLALAERIDNPAGVR